MCLLTFVLATRGQKKKTCFRIIWTVTTVFQERIAKAHGSQCGFCTPGIVMSMYALLRNKPTPKMADVEEAFHGTAGDGTVRRGKKMCTPHVGNCRDDTDCFLLFQEICAAAQDTDPSWRDTRRSLW